MRGLRKWLLLVAFAPLPAFGQSCGGFTDVSPADFYCNNVEWIKNRGVTLGCTETEFCPSLDTIRGQMAAFLNRLGTALTPVIVRATQADFDGTYNPQAIGCQTAPVAITGYPRQASFNASLWNYNASAFKIVQAQLVYSTDAGANWLLTGDSVMQHSLELQQHATLALTGGPLDLVVGSTYQFAIRAITLNTVPTVEGECQLNVRIENRNAATSPLEPLR